MPVRLLLAALTLVLAVPAGAQAIPDDIPDDPTETPSDRQRARLVERHRAMLSRFFSSTHLAAGPAADGLVFDYTLAGGIDLPGGDALHLRLGVRSTPVTADERDVRVPAAEIVRRSVTSFAMGYEARLGHFAASSPFVDRASVKLDVGVLRGRGVGSVTLGVEPTYTLPINAHWSMPVGLRLDAVVLSDSDARMQHLFTGFTLGVKRHFGHRARMVLRDRD